MIQGTELQDHIIAQPAKPVWRRHLPLAATGTALALLAVLLFQATGQSASLVLPRNQMQFATVQRGDLVRDIAVQGRIVAANAPTLYSQETGQVQLFKQPGEAVTIGDMTVLPPLSPYEPRALLPPQYDRPRRRTLCLGSASVAVGLCALDIFQRPVMCGGEPLTPGARRRPSRPSCS